MVLKLGRRARGHFVTLIEIRVHLIRVEPGHISKCEDTRGKIVFNNVFEFVTVKVLFCVLVQIFPDKPVITWPCSP